MGSSATYFSLSSLMCQEGESFDTFFEEDDDDDDDSTSTIGSPCYEPCFVLEDEEEYVEYLLTQETGLGSQNHNHHHHDCSNRYWLMTARLDAIDWIFNTQAKFGFQIHTGYLSVSYFDRFLSKRSFDESKPWAIKLLSVACLSLAAKMEEHNVPTLIEYPVQEYHFQSRVVKNMELLILATLEWKMGSATPFSYLHYFVTRFCPRSNSHLIITKATEHIVAMVKDVTLIDQRPSVIASAAILAAFDATLTRKAIDLRISKISSWGNLESGHVFSCYSLIQEKRRNNVKTPSSNLLSTQSNFTCVLMNQSENSCGVKRKLSFQDSENENCSWQKQKLLRH